MPLKKSYFHAWFRSVHKGRLPARFAILTAYDPRGKKATPAKNRAADKRLAAELDALKIKRFRVTGGNESGSHREPGWGLLASAITARALAVKYDQDAFFWITAGGIYLGSAEGGRLIRAGSWETRQARWA